MPADRSSDRDQPASPPGVEARNAPPVPRDASTVVLVRGGESGAPSVLMGQRGGAARFMPNKMVFPGGAIDASDLALAAALPALGDALSPACKRRLTTMTRPRDDGAEATPGFPIALALAAVRETFEETGLRIGGALEGDGNAALTAALAGSDDPSWRDFDAVPGLAALRFVFRAVTPPSLPVRFDARFFVADADAAVLGDLDDLSRASGELSRLGWAPLDEARALDLPFITSVVLAELQAMVDEGLFAAPALGAWRDRQTPFFRHEADGSYVDPL